MKGRGAKITCPKCAHVFVVFADGASGSASDDPEGRSGSQLRAEDTLRDRLARRDQLTTTSALKAIGLEGEIDTNQTSGKIRVVAPGPRGSRKPVATLDTNQSLAAIGDGDGDGDGEADALYEGPEILDVDQLDFREVGIATWKVKVSIGLVYDFSDIATLKRYLADKRVTPSDLLSHNGKEWTIIGDIPDLDAHFVATWKAARAARKSSPVPKKKKAAVGTQTGGFGTSTGRMGALSPSGRQQTVRPRPKRRRAPKKPAKKRGDKGLGFLAALLVIGGLGYFLTRTPDLAGSAAPGATPSAAESVGESAESRAEQDRIRKGVKDEVARQRKKMMAEEKAAAAIAEAEFVEAEAETGGRRDLSKLEAVRPEYQTTQVGPKGAAAARVLPPPNPAARTAGGMAPPSARGASVADTSVERDEGGSMWLSQGKKALASGNYGNAKSMFQQCVNKNSAAGACWAGLGQSLQRVGEASEAEAAFDRAEALGARVNRSTP
jgi:Flp pilus assembly protein TadD